MGARARARSPTPVRTPVAAAAGPLLGEDATPTTCVKRLFEEVDGGDDATTPPVRRPALRPGVASPAARRLDTEVGSGGHTRVPLAASTGAAQRAVQASHDSDGRFKRDFVILDKVGEGEFGTVYRCRNKIDGRVYAVKESKKMEKSGTKKDLLASEHNAYGPTSYSHAHRERVRERERNKHADTHEHTHTYTHTHIYTYIHTYTHTYIHTQTQTYTHTHIHAHRGGCYSSHMGSFVAWGHSRMAQDEARKHAVLDEMGAHRNVVRYHTVWRESERLYIQSEYCDRGSLDVDQQPFSEAVLRSILQHVAQVRPAQRPLFLPGACEGVSCARTGAPAGPCVFPRAQARPHGHQARCARRPMHMHKRWYSAYRVSVRAWGAESRQHFGGNSGRRSSARGTPWRAVVGAGQL
jgi:hypothetical protein